MTEQLPIQPIENNEGYPFKWHKPIGIISIVFGVLGAMGGILGFVGNKFTVITTRMASPDASSEALESFEQVMSKWGWSTYVCGSIILISGILLLLSGIMCLKLKKACRPLVLTFTILNVVYLALTLYLVLATSMIEEQVVATTELAPSPLGFEAQILLTKVGTIGGCLFHMIYPVFLFFWMFIRGKTKFDVKQYFS